MSVKQFFIPNQKFFFLQKILCTLKLEFELDVKTKTKYYIMTQNVSPKIIGKSLIPRSRPIAILMRHCKIIKFYINRTR